MFSVSEAWRKAYPGASAGILVMRDVVNPEQHAELDRCKAELEQALRARFAGYDRSDLTALPIIHAYTEYYKRFNKTYHVLLQPESVAQRGQSIPRVAALVEAMFMAELKNQLLTAGHGLAAVQTPVRPDVADGSERYTLLNGRGQALKAGDMLMADQQGVISSVLYGPDRRTRITPTTTRVLFAVYALAGIERQVVYQHLADIQAKVEIVAPNAEVVSMDAYGAD